MRRVDLRKRLRDWWRASFAHRVTLLSVSLSLGVSLAIGTGSYAALRGQIKAAIGQDQDAHAQLVEDRLAYALSHLGDSLASLSHNALIINGLVDSQGRESYLRPFLRDFRVAIAGQEDIATTLHDFKGNLVVTAEQRFAIAPDMMKQVLTTGKPLARIVMEQGEAYLTLIQPVIFPPTRSVEGALAVRVPMAPLFASASAGISKTNHLRLLVGDRMVAQTPPTGEESMQMERVLKLGALFDNQALRVVLGTPVGYIQEPLNRLTGSYIVITLLLLPLVAWLAFRGARGLVAPLVRLGATADGIAGSGLILSPPPIEGSDEVGRLANAFGRMLERLRASHDELEQRVLERTEALQEQKERLAEAQRIARLGSWDLDLTTKHLRWSDETYRIFEIDPGLGSLTYETFLALAHPEDLEILESTYQESVRSRSPYECEHRLLMPDGRIKWVHEKGETHFDGEGRPLRSIGTVLDITELKQVQERLQASKSALKAAQHLAHIGNWVWDIQNDVHTWSEELFRMYGRDPALGPAKYPEVQQYFTPQSWTRLACAIETGRVEGIPYECDAELVNADGTHRWITLRGEATRDAEGNVIDLRGTMQEITERKQVEQKLRATLAEKEVMMREIHHRVKNNLQTVSNLLSLQSAYVTDERALGLFRDSQQRIQSMAMVHAQLYQSKNLADINFTAYLQTLVDNLRGQYSQFIRNVAIRIDVQPCTLPVDSAIPCGLVVNELVTNAMKHAFPNERSGEIHISLQCSDAGKLVLEFTDNGVGLLANLEPGRAGFGTRLIKLMVEDQLDGKLTIGSNNPGIRVLCEIGVRK